MHRLVLLILATLPKAMLRKELVRRIMQRLRIERTSEDVKVELGLDHFEGHSYRGWQHDVTCFPNCATFIIAQNTRNSPPRS